MGEEGLEMSHLWPSGKQPTLQEIRVGSTLCRPSAPQTPFPSLEVLFFLHWDLN